MKVKKAWCFFEQSGTFRDRFKELGIEAVCLDIKNDYGKTDIQIDLFAEIKKAYFDCDSIFDKITKDDIVIAFFPCIRFTKQIELEFTQKAPQYRTLALEEKLLLAKQLEQERTDFYNLFCDLILVCCKKHIRLIIENPYSNNHYLVRYFPIRASIIDTNRRERGDYYEKPTQYWFINCLPSYNLNALFREQVMPKKRRVLDYPSGSKERSEISPIYARQFIEEFIL